MTTKAHNSNAEVQPRKGAGGAEPTAFCDGRAGQFPAAAGPAQPLDFVSFAPSGSHSISEFWLNSFAGAAFVVAMLVAAACSAADAAVGWVKSPKNPILRLGPANTFDSQNIFAPAVVKDGGKYFLFYCGGPAGPKTGEELVRYQLGLALSDDGETWAKTGQPLLPLGERDNFHATPSLVRDPAGSLAKIGGLWHMVYCGNRADDVELATSRDGLTWEKSPRSPIFKKAYAPNIIQIGSEFRMYYVHKPGKSQPWEIRLATGADLYSLKPHAPNPVLKVSQPWEKGALFYPYVLREDATWVMFYGSYWQKHPSAKTSTAMGMATSRDGIVWTKNTANPVLTPTIGGSYDSIYTSSESVIRDGELYRLFYAGRVDMVHKYFAIGTATKRGPLVSPR